VRTTADVMMGVVEILRATTEPGDGVVIMPPVYPPFAICTAEAGCVTVPVPLRDTGSAWEMDLAGIEAALQAARGLCSCAIRTTRPARCIRRRPRRSRRDRRAHGAVVISDEIHAPLVADGVNYTPFLTAARRGSRLRRDERIEGVQPRRAEVRAHGHRDDATTRSSEGSTRRSSGARVCSVLSPASRRSTRHRMPG
jgi:hypothetical protein